MNEAADNTVSIFELALVGVMVQFVSIGVMEGNAPFTLQHVIGICCTYVNVTPE